MIDYLTFLPAIFFPVGEVNYVDSGSVGLLVHGACCPATEEGGAHARRHLTVVV